MQFPIGFENIYQRVTSCVNSRFHAIQVVNNFNLCCSSFIFLFCIQRNLAGMTPPPLVPRQSGLSRQGVSMCSNHRKKFSPMGKWYFQIRWSLQSWSFQTGFNVHTSAIVFVFSNLPLYVILSILNAYTSPCVCMHTYHKVLNECSPCKDRHPGEARSPEEQHR